MASNRKLVGFTSWLSSQRGNQNPISDLADDVINDPDWPGDVTAKQLHAHLNARGAAREAHAALYWAIGAWMRGF